MNFHYPVLDIYRIGAHTLDAKLDLGFGLSYTVRLHVEGAVVPPGRANEAKTVISRWVLGRRLWVRTSRVVGGSDTPFGWWFADFYDNDSGDHLIRVLDEAGLT